MDFYILVVVMLTLMLPLFLLVIYCLMRLSYALFGDYIQHKSEVAKIQAKWKGKP